MNPGSVLGRSSDPFVNDPGKFLFEQSQALAPNFNNGMYNWMANKGNSPFPIFLQFNPD